MKVGDKFVTSAGVTLLIRQPSQWAIVQAQRELSKIEPKPPEIFIESKGRKETNSADPDYLAALQLHQTAITERIYEILIITGTKAIKLPEGVGDSESEDFKEYMEALQIGLSQNKTSRYAQWVKYMAEPNAAAILGPLLAMLGTPEKDVSEAIKSAGSNAPGGTDNRDKPQGSNSNGHRVRNDPSGVGSTV